MSAAKRVAHAAETVRARWERQVSTDPQTEAAQALEDTGQLLDPEVAAELAAFRALELGAVDGRVSAACGDPAHPTWLRKPDDLRACPWCRIAELEHAVQQMVEGLNGHDCPPPNEAPLDTVTRWMGYLGAAEARVAELEAERHETNEALDDAVRELRARQSCPCPPEGRPHQVGCPQAEVPPSERPVNGLTAAFMPVSSLRAQLEDPHDGPLAHRYLVPRDLPELGGA